MKSSPFKLFTATVVFAALAIPGQLAAQVDTAQAKKPKHHHYQFIDMGTFGGPMSINQIGPALNNDGTVIGMADTTTADPFYPNFNPLILPSGADPYIYRAFESNNGSLSRWIRFPVATVRFRVALAKTG